MKNRILHIIITFLFVSNAVYSQDFEILKIKENDKYANNLLFRNIFGTFNKTLLFRNQAYSPNGTKFPRMDNKYYILDADANKINDVDFLDSNYLPLAFLNNDTLILKTVQENNWLFFSISQKKYINDIPKKLKVLLENIPHDINRNKYICKFTEMQDAMVVCSDEYNTPSNFTIYRYNYDSVVKQVYDISYFCKYYVIVNVYWVDANNLLFILFSPIKESKYCLYNVKNQKITELKLPEKYAELDDYYNGLFLMRVWSKPYKAAIYDFDIKTLKFTLKHKIYAETKEYNPLYRLGFVSPAKIARMTTSAAVFTEFEIYLNQMQNLIDIKITL
jgi:hypothetical protein